MSVLTTDKAEFKERVRRWAEKLGATVSLRIKVKTDPVHIKWTPFFLLCR
jgi:hypothetical protein